MKNFKFALVVAFAALSLSAHAQIIGTQNNNGAGGAGGAGGSVVGSGNSSAVGTGGSVVGSGNSAATGGSVLGSGNSANANVNDNINVNNTSVNPTISVGGSTSNSNSNSKSEANNSNSINIAAQERNPVSSATAPALQASNGTCLGSTSGGAQGVGFGLSFGTTHLDTGCDARYDANSLVAAGEPDSAIARLCMKPEIRAAREAAGKSCDPKVAKTAMVPMTDRNGVVLASAAAVNPERINIQEPSIPACAMDKAGNAYTDPLVIARSCSN